MTLSSFAIFCGANSAYASAPPLPLRVYGAIQYGDGVMVGNLTVFALIEESLHAETTVVIDDSTPVYLLDIPGDDLDTPAIEGARPGDIVTFQINGIPADQTIIWESGGYVQLDLTATAGPAPPVAQDQALTTGEDTPLAVTLQATDINGDALTYTVVTTPTHGTLTGAAPDLLYTPALDYSGPDSFTFTASDGTGASNVATVSVEITPSADAPRLAAIADPIVTAGEVLEVPLSAVDPEGDAVTLNTIGRPAFANLVDNGDGSGLLVLTPGLGDVGVYPGVEIVAEDATGLKGRTTIVIRVQANQAPDLTLRTFTLSDPNPPRGVTVDLTVELCNDGAGSATDVPVRFTIGPPDTGTLIDAQSVAALAGNSCQTMTQPLNTAGLQLSQVLYATADAANAITELDEGNNQAVVALNLSGAIDNVPPEIRSTPVTSAVTGVAYSYDVDAVDLDGDPLTYALATAPQGMVIDARSGLISWWPQSYDAGKRTVEVTVADGFGGTVNQRFDLEVAPDNLPPTITSTPVIDAVPETLYTYVVDATDPEGTAIEFFLADSPVGMTMNRTTGIIRWTPTAGQIGLHNVIVEAFDVGGASARQGFGVRVLGEGFGPDLVVTRVDNLPVETDTQALSIGGTVDVTVGNAGNQDVTDPFDLLLFDDVDGDGFFSAGVDVTLGQATLSDGLTTGATQVVPVPVSGTQEFRDDLIYAWIDSSDQVAESDEANNYANSGQASQFHPKPGPFTPELLWSWTGSAVEPEYDDVMMTPLVVNLTDDNGDGQIDENDVPDVVFVTAVATTQRAGILRAVSGDDRSELWSVTDPELRARPYHPIAAGDLDGDGVVEIVVHNGNNFIEAPPSPYAGRIMIFEHDGTLKAVGDSNGVDTPLIADMDADGTAEIIVGNTVFNGDGSLRWVGSRPFHGAGSAPAGTPTAASPAVADLDLDGTLELITGIVAYRADGSIFYDVSDNPLLQGYAIALAGGGYTGGLSAVGNFDNDPNPEIVIVNVQVTLLEHDGTIIWQHDAYEANMFGPPTIADFDGDGELEIGSSSEDFYVVLDTDGSLLWRKQIVENSGWNGSTVFDFEGDGEAEVVYNDIYYLRIMRGTDGETLFQIPNPTGTFMEEPVVADVNNDGHAELILFRNQFGFDGSWVATDSGIFVYGDKWDNWVGTRRIWNQHAYHITNVNEDGTIPQQQEPGWLRFNTYRANAQTPDEADNGPFAAPDLSASFIRVDQSSCPADVTLAARVGNGGGDVVPAGVNVSFYDGDPAAGAPLIGTATTSTTLEPGAFQDVAVLFNAPPADYRRLVVVADDGGGPTRVESTDLARLPGTRIGDYANFNATSAAIDGDAASHAFGGTGVSFIEVVFPRPVNIESLEIVVPGAPASTYYPLCGFPTTASLTLSNGFSIPLEVTCGDQGPELLPAPAFFTPAMAEQTGVTTLRLDFETTESYVDVGEIIVEGSYYDERQGVLAEGREDNNVTAYSVALCGGEAPTNALPTFQSTPPTSATVGIPMQYTALATDLDGDTVTYTLAGAPAGMSINATTGAVLWIPLADQVGVQTVTIAASDGRGGVSEQTFTVDVVMLNQPPVITSTPVTAAQAGTPYAYAVTADDPENTPLRHALLTAPAGMNINATTGQIGWAPTAGDVGSHPVTVQVRDGAAASAEQSFSITVDVGTAGMDLLISTMDNRGVNTNLQSLAMSGAVQVTFGNGGDSPIVDAFDLLLFADTDGNGQYDAGSDAPLGTTTWADGLGAGQFVTVNIPVSGNSDFRDDLIYGLVDSAAAIVEADETNNLHHTGLRSQRQLGDDTYRVITEQTLPIPNWRLRGAPLVINLTDDNGDGAVDARDMPEIVYADDSYALNAWSTETGTQLWRYPRNNTYNFANGVPATGDLDNDGIPEIVVMHINNNRVIIFNADGTPRLISEPWSNNVGGQSAASIVNIDRQGPAEILVGNVLVNADGTVRCQGNAPIGVPLNAGYQSSAVDLDLSGDMEFVVGNKAYASDCSVVWERSDLPDGYASVGNVDDDPTPEIVLVGLDMRLWVLEHDGTTKSGPIAVPGGFIRGLVAIADYDGDGVAEIGVIGNRVSVFEADLTQTWEVCCNFWPGSSFDFEGDGRAEIVVTSENAVYGNFLHIFDGATGAELYKYAIRPAINTWPYPVVADVDGDGTAEIVVPTDQGMQILGHPLDAWAATKPVWAQQTHHDVNITDDGMIPLSEPPYSSGRIGFKQNPARLFAADITAAQLTVNQNSCPANVEVTARIGNGGSAQLPAGTAVTLYDTGSGIPEQLVATSRTSVNLAPGEFEDVSFTLSNPAAGLHGLRAVVNVDVEFDNLNWLPGVTASGSAAYNGATADSLLDQNVYSGWCGSAPTTLDIAYPYPVDVGFVRLRVDNNPQFGFFTSGTIELSNGFSIPAIFDGSGNADIVFSRQTGITSVRFTSTEQRCLGEIEVGGAVSQPPASDGSDIALNNALSYRWPLDANVLETVQGASGRVLGAPQIVAGIATPGYRLDGNNDAIVVDEIALPNGQMSIALWIRTEETQRRGTLFSFATDANPDALVLADADNLTFCNGLGATGGDTACAPGSGIVVNDGRWHHVVLTVDQFRHRIFVDGQLVHDPNGYGTTLTTPGTLVFGQDQDVRGGGYQISQAYAGVLDDVKIFDRVLSAEEVQIEYGSRVPNDWIFAARVAEGRADNNQVTRAVELCTSANTPPRIISTPVTEVEAGSAYVYDIDVADAEDDTPAFRLLAAPTGMTIDTASGTIDWTPASGHSGSYGVTVEVNDGNGGFDTQTFSLVVTTPPPVNQPPVCTGTDLVLNEDSEATLILPCIDPDAGDSATVAIIDAPSHGSADLNGAIVTYRPDADYAGPDSFTYQATDAQGVTSTPAVATVSVTPVNDPPIATGQALTTTAGADQPITLSASDAEGTELTYELIITPYNGQLSGTVPDIVYRAADAYAGPDVLTYRVSDGETTSAIAVVDIFVQPKPAPVLTVQKDDGIDVIRPGQRITYTLTVSNTGTAPAADLVMTDTLPAHTTLIDAGTGVISDGDVVWNLGELAVGARITRTVVLETVPLILDDAGSMTNTVTVRDVSGSTASTLDVNVLEARPLLALEKDDQIHQVQPGDLVTYTVTITNSGNRVATGLLLTDTLPGLATTLDASDAGTISATSVVWPPFDLLPQTMITRTVAIRVAASIPADVETITNTAVLWNGESTLLTARDVNAVDAAPNLTVTKDDGVLRADPGTLLTYTITVSNLGAQTAQRVILTDTLPVSTTLISASGTPVATGDLLVWTMEALAPEAVVTQTVTLAVSDIESAPNIVINTVVVTTTNQVDSDPENNQAADRTAINRWPLATADSAASDENQAIDIDVLANDSDPDGDSLSIIAVGRPDIGATENVTTSVVFTPATGFVGTAVFTYTVSDGSLKATAPVTVTVRNVNEAPRAQGDVAETMEDEPITIDALGNDRDPDGDTLVLATLGTPTYGTVISDSVRITYMPSLNFNGTDVFIYTVSDGVLTDTARVTVTVAAVNDPPLATGDAATTDENTSIVIDVLANDVDVDGDALTIALVETTDNGSVAFIDAALAYTPSAGFAGTDVFTYTVSDGLLTDSARVTVTVNNVNVPPVAADDTVTTAEDTPIRIDPLENDSDLDEDLLFIVALGGLSEGKATLVGASVYFTPDLNFNGTTTFTYTVSDGALEDSASIDVTVTPVNDAPTAGDDTAAVDENISVSINVLANDTDVDGDTLTVTAVGLPASGSAVSLLSSIDYTPSTGFVGTDVFTYTVTDGALTATARVTVTVNNVNDPPLAADDVATTAEDTPVTIPVLANDTDVDGDILTVADVGATPNGSTTTDGQSVAFTPVTGFFGTATFTYTVSDGMLADTALVAVEVNEVNAPPQAIDDQAMTDEGVPVTVSVLDNDSDPDNDPLTVVAVGVPEAGTTVTDGTSITYDPGAGVVGSATFTYTVSDGALTATATVVVTVNAVNVAPDAQDDVAFTDEDVPVTILVLDNDVDADSDSLSLTVLGAVPTGTAVIDGTAIVYTPAPNINGSVTYTYTVSDGALTDTASVTVEVRAVNDPPLAFDDDYTTDEDVAQAFDVLTNDVDVDGDQLSIGELGQPMSGTVSLDISGLVVYTPTLNFYGIDRFWYIVSDGLLNARGAVTVSVHAINDAPIAVDDEITTTAITTITIPVLDNDVDVDGDNLTVITATQPMTGQVGIGVESTLIYTSALDYTGLVTFTYEISDTANLTDSAVVTVNVVSGVECMLYPIALQQNALSGRVPGDLVDTIGEGVGSGSFGWLTWRGSNDTQALATSLTPPGDSHTYVNPDNPADRTISVGDWVQVVPGNKNARSVRDALDALRVEKIVVPVWDVARGQGANLDYQVVDFVTVQVVDYRLNRQPFISVRYLGSAVCSSEQAAAARVSPYPIGNGLDHRVFLPFIEQE